MARKPLIIGQYGLSRLWVTAAVRSSLSSRWTSVAGRYGRGSYAVWRGFQFEADYNNAAREGAVAVNEFSDYGTLHDNCATPVARR
jgi:hypothetical protein